MGGIKGNNAEHEWHLLYSAGGDPSTSSGTRFEVDKGGRAKDPFPGGKRVGSWEKK